MNAEKENENEKGEDLAASRLSLDTTNEDWDRSVVQSDGGGASRSRNSVAFPAEGEGDAEGDGAAGKEGKPGKRTISELLRVHAEKGTNVQFSAEEASRVAEVLGQWINSESSPYEGEDDFFARALDVAAAAAAAGGGEPASEAKAES